MIDCHLNPQFSSTGYRSKVDDIDLSKSATYILLVYAVSYPTPVQTNFNIRWGGRGIIPSFTGMDTIKFQMEKIMYFNYMPQNNSKLIHLSMYSTYTTENFVICTVFCNNQL